MFYSFIKSTLRSFKRSLGFSIINVLGLAIGIACSVLIIVYVNYEFSYDNYNEKANRIYRIAQKGLIGNTQLDVANTPAPLFTVLLNDYPEIESATRLAGIDHQRISVEDRAFIQKHAMMADSTLFNVFTFHFIKGSPKHALNQPNKVVLSESTAIKYFGDIDPIGKTLKLMNHWEEIDLEVTAVIEDMPDNSHFHSDFIVSSLSFKEWYDSKEWQALLFKTYIVLKKGFSNKAFEAKLPNIANKYIFDGKYEKWSKDGNFWKFYLQPLLDIHLNSDITDEFEPNGKKNYIYIFFVVAIIILLIACINFMNLNTAKSSARAREVGVRKVVGARKRSLIIQFIGESILTSLIALVIGMALVETLLPAYGNLIGCHLEIHYFNNFLVLPLLILLAVLVGIIPGSYPAFFLSSFKPINILKGKLQSGSKRPWLRNTLVVVQFTISIVLIIGTLVIYKQMIFLQQERLGFNKEQVLLLENTFALGNNIQVFKDDLTKFQGIESVSLSTAVPGRIFNGSGFGCDGKDEFILKICYCDQDFQDVTKIEMDKGRFFSNKFSTDTAAIIINEAAVKLLEWEQPIGKVIKWREDKLTVIGVVKDFNYESKHQKIQPMALLKQNWSYYLKPNFISIRVKSDKYDEAINYIDKSWKKYTNGVALEYSFLDEDYDKLYKNEKQTKQLFIVFSILAIFIACLGLLGLTSYMTEQRTKEIGIRKIMGASVSTITIILSANFTRWVLLSNLFAWPIAYYLMTKWLENFAYKVNISWWMFAIAGLLSIIIALITISYQSIKAATRNPIESLRYE